jgi:hypothetical protein
MARIESLTLDPITVDVANATVDVHFTVEYSRSDQDANTPYKLVCKLEGHDPGGEFGEDDVDDVIPNGRLTPAGGQTIRSDGEVSQEFDFNTTLALSDLDEDFIGSADPDEIKAKVTLKPILPQPVSAESNIRRLHATP